MHRLIKARLACALAWFLALAPCGADAQEQSFPAGNCALTPPPGWQVKDLKNQPSLIAAYGDPAGTRTLLVLAQERGKAEPPLDEASAANFDKGVEDAGGGPKTSGKFVQFAGFPTYERRGTAVVKGKHLSTLTLAISTGDGMYLLEALGTKNDVSDDEEVQQSLKSFRFLHPPGAPRQPPDAAYRAGYLTGQLLMGGIVLGGIVWIITKAASRRNPPPPTGFSGPYPYPQAGFPPPPAARPPFPSTGPAAVPPPLPPPPPPPAP